MPTQWRPLSKRATAGEGYDDTLHEGVPAWLKQSLLEWANPAIQYEETLLAVERNLRVSLRWRHGGHSAYNSLVELKWEDEGLMLDVVDYVLGRSDHWRTLDSAAELAVQLHQAGSAWTVAETDSAFQLERRVQETEKRAVESTISRSGRAGSHLQMAWSSVYGRNPNPGDSYGESIKAVEAAAQPIISPKNTRATLGTMIRDIGQAPTKWQQVLDTPHGIAVVREMFSALWTGQHDRHGTQTNSCR